MRTALPANPRISASIEKPCWRHSWRLLERTPRHSLKQLVGHDEVWYCTGCRRVEELFAPADARKS